MNTSVTTVVYHNALFILFRMITMNMNICIIVVTLNQNKKTLCL